MWTSWANGRMQPLANHRWPRTRSCCVGPGEEAAGAKRYAHRASPHAQAAADLYEQAGEQDAW